MSEPDTEFSDTASSLEFPVVGIGASAGGLKALLDLFRGVPRDSGMAFVVIVHLSPEYESHLGEVLQRVTPIPILAVTESVPIERDRIYIISPRSRLSMQDGHLEPTPQPKRSGGPMTIDLFFETLAEAHGTRAFCIVLSGTGSDGTRGATAVKARGGITLVQTPAEAEYDAMPQSVITSGAADFVLPVAEMPAKLASLWDSAQGIRLPDAGKPSAEDISAEDITAKAEEALREVLRLTKARTRHDFSQYKRGTLLRRIERRLQVNQLKDLPSYRDFVREHPAESRSLLRDLLISVTAFFRDEAAFEALAKSLIPALFAQTPEGGALRIWVVGCATGEEVYSIAILLREYADTLKAPPELSLFATDIDENAIAKARAALYPDSIREQISPERLQRFFVKEQFGYRVQRLLRDRVMFAAHNALQDPPFSRIDLVACRNLLIYLDRDAQRRLLDLLHFSLRPDGYLMLGRSETVDERDGFAVVDAGNRIFQQRPRTRTSFTIAALPPAQPQPGEHAGTATAQRIFYGDLHQRLLEHYGPPSVVVDDRYDVVHVSDTAGRYLQLGPGEPSVNLLRVVPEELRFELRNALDQAMQSMRTVERQHVAFRRGAEVAHVDISVQPVRDRKSTRLFALILFDEATEARDVAAQAAPAGERDAVGALEHRLHEAEARLRALSEQHEVQSEEARAANEELQVTNEELRATSEELETGKEELQSINEELLTVNQELKNKIDESARLGDDLRNFVNATEIPILFVDRTQRLMRFTPFARQIFNVIDADIGRALFDITHRLLDSGLDADVRAVIETLRTVEREVRTTDGRTYTLRVLPYRTTDDRIGGAVLTFFDITARREAQESGRRNETWLRLVIESVRDYAILRLDPQGGIVSWNAASEAIFGYAESEAIGRSFRMLFTPEDQADGVPERILATAKASGRAESDRWKVRKDGTRFLAKGVTAPLPDPDTSGYVKVLRDLSEERAEAEHREALIDVATASQLAAEESSQLKDQFLATLSHELRNPLALIQMQAELVLRAPETRQLPRIASAAQIIHQTVRVQAQFVDDLIDVSRIRTGKLTVDRQLLPLPLVIADSIGALRDEAERNKITLTVEIEAEPMFVEADAVRVKQIAWNLLSNAIKFTPNRGQVLVRLRREGNEARLDVEDNGQGIAPEVLPHIFEWFLQAESGPARRKGGMGIGLALVKQLVELHGGRVTGRSEGLGKGACFSVWLPLQLQDAKPLPPLLLAPPDVPAATAPLSGLRILIIDDLADNAAAMAELLQYEGADTALEITAHAAILRASNEAFDVIISDLAMPEMDGFAMLGKLRASPLNAKTPAIAYSGYGGAEEVARSKEAGFELHLVKPVDVDRLLEAIEELTMPRLAAGASVVNATR